MSFRIVSEWFTPWPGKQQQNHQDGYNCTNLNFVKMSYGKVFTKNNKYEKLVFTFWIIGTKTVKCATKIFTKSTTICSFSATGNSIHIRVA